MDGLSDATKRAQQIARDHGGTVASLQYDAPSQGVGTAQITLRIPTAKVEGALAELSQLGTILGQRYGIDDLQQQADSLQTQIEQTQRRIAQLLTQLENPNLSNEDRVVLQSRLTSTRQKLTGLRETLRSTRAEAATSTVYLTLTTEEIQAAPVGSGRLEGVKDVLAWEAIALLYALVVVGPFVLLGVLVWLPLRLRRRARRGCSSRTSSTVQRQLGPHRRAPALLARDAERPPSASTRSDNPRRPSPCRRPRRRRRRRRPRPGAPVVSSEIDPRLARRGVLGDVRERLRDDVERGGLDRLREPRRRQAVHLHRQRRARGERLHGRRETVVGEDRRMDPARELTELLESERQLVARLRDQLRSSRGSSASRDSAMRRWSASVTRRCCAPSWRLRSSRRRSASPA